MIAWRLLDGTRLLIERAKLRRSLPLRSKRTIFFSLPWDVAFQKFDSQCSDLCAFLM